MNKIVKIFFLMVFFCFCTDNSKEDKIFESDNLRSYLLNTNFQYLIFNRIDSLNLPETLFTIELESKNKYPQDHIAFNFFTNEFDRIYFYKHILYYSQFYSNKVVSIEFTDLPNLPSEEYRSNRLFGCIIKTIKSNKNVKNQKSGGKKCIYLKYSNSALEIPEYPGAQCKIGINETTDTIYSSLQPWVIKKIFPEYKGSIIQEKIKKIVIDYQYNPKDLEFYNNIEIIKE